MYNNLILFTVGIRSVRLISVQAVLNIYVEVRYLCRCFFTYYYFNIEFITNYFLYWLKLTICMVEVELEWHLVIGLFYKCK